MVHVLSLIAEADSYRVPMSQLQSLVTAMLQRVQVPTEDAQILAEALVLADARGMNSHGVMRLPIYIKRLQQGGFAPVTKFDLISETPSTALVDAGNGLGAVATTRAMDLAIAKAQISGIAAVGVRASNHNGEGAYYVMRAVRAGMIGIATTNGSPIMPVWGGTTPMTAPLPIAFGIPTDKELPIVLDTALGMSSRGKILYYAEKKLQLPLGWLVDSNGTPTTDPSWINNGGWILPIGGHKGWGLIFMCEILCGILTGGGFGRELTNLYGDLNQGQGNGHFVIAINISAFIEPEFFKKRMDECIREMKASELMPGVSEILMPGEIEFRREMKQQIEGVTLTRSVLDEVITTANILGLATEFDATIREGVDTIHGSL
jgi:LDH2 family malate/lactate/ureidoglycolate dehydrogenase